MGSITAGTVSAQAGLPVNLPAMAFAQPFRLVHRWPGLLLWYRAAGGGQALCCGHDGVYIPLWLGSEVIVSQPLSRPGIAPVQAACELQHVLMVAPSTSAAGCVGHIAHVISQPVTLQLDVLLHENRCTGMLVVILDAQAAGPNESSEELARQLQSLGALPGRCVGPTSRGASSDSRVRPAALHLPVCRSLATQSFRNFTESRFT